MKKIISFLLVAVMLLALATSAFAAEGETVEIAVSAKGNPGFAAYQIKLGFDASALELTGVTEGALSAGGMVDVNAAEGLILFVKNGANIEGDGVLFNATFNVKGEGNYDVTAALLDAYNEALVGVDFELVVEVVKAPAHVHQWGEWVEIKAPDCDEYGVDQRTCATCGETETRQGAKPLGHAFGDWIDIGNPNYHQRACVRCDAVENEGHKMVELKELEKTEEIDGFLVTIKTHKCEVCGYTVEGLDKIPLTGDITPVVVGSAVAVIAMITLAGYMLKRKFAL